MRGCARIALLSSLFGCVPSAVSLDGKRCSTDHPCPSGFRCRTERSDPSLSVCVASDDRTSEGSCGPDDPCSSGVCCPCTASCTPEESCPSSLAGKVVRCGIDRDLYLSPNGSTSSSCESPDQPCASLSGITLQPGHRVHLHAGTYATPLVLGSDGAASCPISLLGEGDETVLTTQVTVRGAYWVLSDFRVEAPQAPVGILVVSGADNVSIERVSFRNTGAEVSAASAEGHVRFSDCRVCSVLSSTFETTYGPPVEALFASSGSSPVIFRGNRVRLLRAEVAVQVNDAGALVEGNEFSGSYSRAVLAFGGAGENKATVRRNVFRDIFAEESTLTIVDSAKIVESNTFIDATGDVLAAELDADAGPAFANNILARIARGTNVPAPTEGRFNLFDEVASPYANGEIGPMDVTGGASLDPDTLTPSTASKALDAADPALQIPPGGGDRADIGAKERGAIPMPDGLYCVP